MGLQRVAYLLEIGYLFHKVVLYAADGALLLLLARHKEIGGVYLVVVHHVQPVIVHGVHLFYAVYLVVPPRHAEHILAVGHEYVDGVAAHTEIAALKVDVVTHIEGVNQAAQKVVAVQLLAALDADHTVGHGGRAAHAVDARHRRHHHYIAAPAKQGGDGGKTQTVYLVVDGKIFFYIGVGLGQIGLRLVVVVVRHVILYGVLGEKTAHLFVELGGKGLVVAQYEGGALHVGYHVGHREGLARTGHTKKYLGPVAALHTLGELTDGLGLVAGRTVGGGEFKFHGCLALWVGRIFRSFSPPCLSHLFPGPACHIGAGKGDCKSRLPTKVRFLLRMDKSSRTIFSFPHTAALKK